MVAPASRIRCSSASSSGVRVDGSRASVLLTATTRGLLRKSGLICSKSATCSAIECPHSSEMSSTYMTQHCRWASAVIDCISMVLRSSSGLSSTPGVSMTCQRRYL
eukprot:scaffold155360_cov25-Tisochrysis_lutea.AAC.4